MNGSCHCGQVTIRVPAEPEYLNACNCTVCTKLGALWGYYSRRQVGIAGETRSYLRSDVEQPNIGFDFCGQCGATTSWSPRGSNEEDRMGVNMRLFDPAELTGIEIRYGDRRNHDTAPRRYYREPTIFDGAGAQP